MPITFSLKNGKVRTSKAQKNPDEFDAGVLLLLARHRSASDLRKFRAGMSPKAIEVANLLVNGDSARLRKRNNRRKTSALAAASAYKKLAALVR